MMFKGDWGCFPNKQICEDCTEGKIEKMSEPVQVYTACQFVTPIICGQNYSQVGNKTDTSPHKLGGSSDSNFCPVRAEVNPHLFPTWAQVILCEKAGKQDKFIALFSFCIFSFGLICKMAYQGNLPDTL